MEESDMWTTAAVRKYVFNLSDGQVFATRELLGFGKRGAVDKALGRLVGAAVIVRVARGVFVKPFYDSCGKLILPTLAQIVMTKAQAFGKQIFTHGKDAAHAFGFVESDSETPIAKNEEPTFTASGSSTSFLCKRDFGWVRVHLRSSSPLSKKFVDTTVGLFYRAMRSIRSVIGSDADVECANFAKAHDSFNKTQRNEVKAAAKWMPGWLSQLFWFKLPSKGQTRSEDYSCEFLRKYMTDEEYVEFMRSNVSS
jgi:Family of unknown function (DUF6088)